MSRIIALTLLFTLLSVVAFAADPVEEVRQAEIAFAKAFADRDAGRFFSFVAEDATFLGFGTLRGKKQVIERWSRFFEGPQAPFSWGPERVSVDAAGKLGLSTGPVFSPDGIYTGNYISTWMKQQDGSWKILFDSSGPSGPTFADEAVKVDEGFVTADDGVKLHYRRVGTSPITVIIPLDFMLHDEFRGLADMATVITYDPRNRGRSERMKDVSAMSLDWDVDDLEAVRRHFKVEKFVPVGFSYLGKVAALYAIEYPNRVSRIVQLGPAQMDAATKYPKELTHGYEDIGAPADLAAKWKEMRKNNASVNTPREFCDIQSQFFQYLLVGDPKKAPRVKFGCDLENEWPVNFEVQIKPLMESLTKTPLTAESLKPVTMPVLTIHGAKDRIVPYGSGREWATSLADARLITIADAGHVAWVDNPPAVFAAIRGFLRGEWPLGTEKVAK